MDLKVDNNKVKDGIIRNRSKDKISIFIYYETGHIK